MRGLFCVWQDSQTGEFMLTVWIDGPVHLRILNTYAKPKGERKKRKLEERWEANRPSTYRTKW